MLWCVSCSGVVDRHQNCWEGFTINDVLYFLVCNSCVPDKSAL